MTTCNTCSKPAAPNSLMCRRCRALNDMMNAYYSFVGHANFYQHNTEKIIAHSPNSVEDLRRISAEINSSHLSGLAGRLEGIERTAGLGNLVPAFTEMITRRIKIHPAPQHEAQT